jgi:hypothetical protein
MHSPLLGLVATQPHLLVAHLQAYAELAVDDVAEAAGAWRRRVVLSSLAFGCAGAALVLAGVAVMLWGVAPLTAGYRLWTLVVVPVVPAILALSCWIVLLAGRRTVFLGNVRSQIRADVAMLRDGGA